MAYFGFGAMPWFNRYSGAPSRDDEDDERDYGYTPPPTFDYATDEEAQRRDKRRAGLAGLAALTGGMLDSYMNQGQGVGRAFESQQAARNDVLDRARDEARQDYLARRQTWEDDRARRSDEELGAYRRKQQENIDTDNARQQAAADAKARDESAATAREETQRVERARQNKALVGVLQGSDNPDDRALAARLAAISDPDDFPTEIAVRGAPRHEPREPRAPTVREIGGRPYELSDEGRWVPMDVAGGIPSKPDDKRTPPMAQFDADVGAETNRLLGARIEQWKENNPQRYEGPNAHERALLRAEVASAARRDVAADYDNMGYDVTRMDEARAREQERATLRSDPGYSDAVEQKAEELDYDVTAARRAGVSWLEIRRVLGLM